MEKELRLKFPLNETPERLYRNTDCIHSGVFCILVLRIVGRTSYSLTQSLNYLLVITVKNVKKRFAHSMAKFFPHSIVLDCRKRCVPVSAK